MQFETGENLRGYYQLSGRYSAGSLAAVIVIGFFTAVILGGLHGILYHYIPYVKLSLLAGIVMAAAMGGAINLCGTNLKIRNPVVMILAALFLGIVYEYFMWIGWIYAISDREAIVIDLLSLFYVMSKLSETGFYTIGGSTPVGWFLWMLWFAESAIYMGMIVGIVQNTYKEKIFSENSQIWITRKKDFLPRPSVSDWNNTVRLLEAGIFDDWLKSAEPREEAPNPYIDIYIMHNDPDEEFFVMTIIESTITRDNKGNETTVSRTIVKNLHVTKEVWETLDQQDEDFAIQRRSKIPGLNPAMDDYEEEELDQ